MSVVSSLVVEIGSDISGLTRGINNADRHIDGFASNGRSNFASMGAVAVGVGAAVIGVGVAATDAAMEWETAFTDVRKTVEASDEQLDLLEQQLRDMATDATNPVSGMEDAHLALAKIASLAGSLGIPTEDIAEFTEQIAMLDMSSDLTAESAATMAAQFANITGMDMSNISNFASAVVDVGNKLATTEPQLLEFASRMAGAGDAAGMSEADILGFAGALASMGLDPEAGGTAFTQTINTIVMAAARGGEELDILATTSGTTAEAFRTSWEDDPAGALVDFLEGLGEMDPASRIAALDALGLSGIRVSDMLTRMSGNTELVTDALNIANDAWEENTALQTEAEAKFATTEAQMNVFKNNVRDLGIELGEVLLPIVNDVAAGLTSFTQDVKEGDTTGIKNHILSLAEGLSGIQLPDFETSIAGWQTFADSVGIIITELGYNLKRDFNTIGRDAEETFTRLQIAATDAQIALGINYDANVAFKDTELVPRIQGIESAEMLESQLRDSIVAGDVSVDMSEFVTSDPALIAAKIIDPMLIQEAMNTALAEGDTETFDLLAPIAMELDIDPESLIYQYQLALTFAADSTTPSIDITADITVLPGSIDMSAVESAIGASGTVQPATVGATPVPGLSTGGYIANEGLAYLHDDEVVLNPAQTQDYMRGGRGAGSSPTQVNIYAQSVDQILAELARRGVRVA